MGLRVYARLPIVEQLTYGDRCQLPALDEQAARIFVDVVHALCRTRNNRLSVAFRGFNYYSPVHPHWLRYTSDQTTVLANSPEDMSRFFHATLASVIDAHPNTQLYLLGYNVGARTTADVDLIEVNVRAQFWIAPKEA